MFTVSDEQKKVLTLTPNQFFSISTWNTFFERFFDKHSSLFVSTVSDEQKKFFNFDTKSVFFYFSLKHFFWHICHSPWIAAAAAVVADSTSRTEFWAGFKVSQNGQADKQTDTYVFLFII